MGNQMSGHNILGIPVEAILAPIAAKLAHMDDQIQKQFFATFADELLSACETEYEVGIQCTHIRGTLTEKQREIFANIGWDGKAGQ